MPRRSARRPSTPSVAAPVAELLALQGPLAVAAQPAVVAHEPLRTARITAQLPLEPADGDRRGGPAIRFVEGAAVADRKIGDGHRHVGDPREVVHAVGVGDVGGAALDVDHRRVQCLQHILADADASHGGGPVVQHAAVVDDQRLDPWVLRDLERLYGSATPSRIRDLCWIDAPEVRAAGALVLGQRPVNRVGQVRHLRARRWELTLWRRWTWLPRRCAGTAQDAAAGDDQVSVGGDLEQVESAAGAVVRTPAVAP